MAVAGPSPDRGVDEVPIVDTMAELERADSIVLGALELPQEERHAYVRRMCAGSTPLRREVESLLGVGSHQLAELERPVFQIHLETAAEPASEGRIGPYQTERVIGRGGVATVYLGRRVGDPDRRALALKVLRPGLDSEEIVRSFRREGHILAQLRHPYIGRVYGGGLTEDHRPYLVMEHIEGEDLVSHLRHRRATVRARLELFLKICEAIEHAHGRLVVHSDIKPANILVTETGEPRVLDFGIAKLLDATTEQPITVTALGRRMLTPAYASPEQVRHQPVAAATDVYALGVVLYELLTEKRPLDFAAPDADWRRVVCEEEALPPSRASEIAGEPGREGRRRRLSKDLDAIVAKALRKEPAERYPSVRALSDDLVRHLEGRPVEARRGTLAYRAGKLLRRHRGLMLAVSVVLLTAVAFLVDRERQLDRLQVERDKAWEVRDFLVELLTGADPYEHDREPPTVRQLLERSYDRLEELDGRPEVQAMVMGTLGEMFASLGDFERAEPLLEASVAREKSHPDSPAELIQALYRLAVFEQERGRVRRSVELLEECVTLLRRHRIEGVDLPRVLGDLGLAHRGLGENEAAVGYFQEALRQLEALGEAGTAPAHAVRNNLGLVLFDETRYDEAAELFEGLLADRRRLGAERLEVGLTAINLASSYEALGDYAAAEAAAREAHRLLLRHLGPAHPNTAAAALALAKVLRSSGDEDAAIAVLQASRGELERQSEQRLPVVAAQALLLGELLDDRDPEAALAELRFAEALWREIFGPDHPQLADFLVELAQRASGEEARTAAQRAFEIYRDRFGEEHPATAEARELVGTL